MRMTHVAGSSAFNSSMRRLASKAMARRWMVALGIFALTCAVFAPAVRGGFIMIDDPVYVVTNPLVTGGLSLDAVRRAFVTPTSDLWLPLSTISHMADVTLFGLDPTGHHLTNVLLHALNAALVFLVLCFLAHPDRAALVRTLGLGLLVLALPWLTAEWGFHFPGDVFSGEEIPEQRDPDLEAVHFGFHHGYGGVLLASTALALSRIPAGRNLRAYLSLMLAYGLANALQDAWNEQLWKSGWVDVSLPSVQRPELTWGWLVIVLGAALVYALWFRPARQR